MGSHGGDSWPPRGRPTELPGRNYWKSTDPEEHLTAGPVVVVVVFPRHLGADHVLKPLAHLIHCSIAAVILSLGLYLMPRTTPFAAATLVSNRVGPLLSLRYGWVACLDTHLGRMAKGVEPKSGHLIVQKVEKCRASDSSTHAVGVLALIANGGTSFAGRRHHRTRTHKSPPKAEQLLSQRPRTILTRRSPRCPGEQLARNRLRGLLSALQLNSPETMGRA